MWIFSIITDDVYITMDFINTTGNTVYIEDIDLHVLYNEAVQQIDEINLLRSKSFQQMVLLNGFKIVHAGNTRIEQNLLRMQKGMAKLKQFGKMNKTTPLIEENVSTKVDKQVVIKGHFLDAGGYAKVNRNLALGLSTAGIDVKIDIIANKNQLDESETRQINKMIGKGTQNAVYIDSVIPSFGTMKSRKNSILYTTIESYSVTDQFLELANRYKEVWVTSDFCKEMLEGAGLKRPIFVLPDSIDINIYTEKGDKYRFKPELKKFVFLSVFGWSYRKGYDTLLKSYIKEFSGDDDVTLLLVTRFQNESKRTDIVLKEVNKYIKESGKKNPPHIVRCHKVIPESIMPSIYRACDAFVLPSRGEGFGLPYCEASLCGLPVIATNCSGQKMFLKHNNSYLIEPDELVKISPGMMHIHYWDEQKFPALMSTKVIKDCGKKMREVYKNYNKALKRNKKLQKFIMSNYSIGHVATKAINKLNKIWDGEK